MASRSRVDAQRPWAELVGYSRAVRVGNVVEVGGTSATLPSGEVPHPYDAYQQTVQILTDIGRALRELGADLGDVIRTCAYLTNIDNWQDVGRAHGETFRDILPVSTFVEVSRLLLPTLVVELEATAIIGDGHDSEELR